MPGKRLYISELVLIVVKYVTITVEERNIKVIIPSHLQITENYTEKFSIMLGKHVPHHNNVSCFRLVVLIKRSQRLVIFI